MGPAVQHHIRRASERELDHECRCIRIRSVNLFNVAVGQKRDVELRRFFALIVKPEARTRSLDFSFKSVLLTHLRIGRAPAS